MVLNVMGPTATRAAPETTLPAARQPPSSLACSPAAVFESSSPATPQNKIDQFVFLRLRELSIQPAELCSDAVFVRRAFLDVIGTLPTASEASEFLSSRDVGKRGALIERLLARDEFADYWAMKWCDILRVKAEFPINLWPNAAQAYHHWLRSSIRENMTYDRFARELLTSSGSNFRVPQVNFYRAMQNREPEAIARTVALTFMGARAERWPKERLTQMSAFFCRIGYKQTAEWKEEIVLFTNAPSPATAALWRSERSRLCSTAVYPDGTTALLPEDRDPRELFATWLTNPKNPWFARNIVNRIWYWLLGRGIVHEPDDLRDDNPPSNPELLAWLESELVASNYDLKHIYRLILNSSTYQLSSIPKDQAGQASDLPQSATGRAREQNDSKPGQAGGLPYFEANFACYSIRRLEAEVLADAVNQITGGTEKYSSAIPEPFTYIPEHQRSISLPDGSITSSFLELFGRSPRDTGLESERNNRPTAAQRLHLLNSSHIQKKLEQSRYLQNLEESDSSPRQAVSGLYLMILSRYPSENEWNIISAYGQSDGIKSHRNLCDLSWSLLNSDEFLYRH